MNLAHKQYAASTWPIKEWDGAKRNFGDWYYKLRHILDNLPERISESMGISSGRSRKSSTTLRRRGGQLQGYKLVGELLIIPQSKPGILSGNGLVYADLKNDKKRKEMIQKLLGIL